MLELRPVHPPDYPFLYQFLVGGETGSSWRFRGMTPSPDQFERTLWAGVLGHFVAELEARPVGYACAFNPMLEAQHCQVGMALIPEMRATGLAARMALLLLDYVFEGWPYRKVYAHVPEWNLRRLRSLERYGFSEEARLRDFSFSRSRFWDEVIFSIDRARWTELTDRLQTSATRSSR